MRSKLISRPLLAVLALLIFIFAFQGSRGIWEPDEGRYTAVALNMLSYDDSLTPRLNDDVSHFGKPPLTYWLIAACVRSLGAKEWVLRLPNSLAFFGTCIVIYGIGLRLVNKKPWLPVLIYCTSAFPFFAANIVTPDTILVFWETLAVFGFISAVFYAGSNRRRLFLNIMWVGFGMAFLTKGPPALLPLLVVVIYTFLPKRRGAAKNIFTPEGLLSFLTIGFGWYFAAAAQNKGLLSYLLRYEFFFRIASGIHERNPKWYMPFAIYLPIIIFGSFPWTFAFVSKFRKPKDTAGLFLLLWLLVPLGIFCLARSRLPFYILPLFVPLSLMIARHLQSSAILNRRWARIALFSWIFIILAAKGATGGLQYSKDSRALALSIKQQVNEPLETIVFMDKAPYYGLRLYLDIEVLRASVYNSDYETCRLNKEIPFERELRAIDSGEKHLIVVPAYNFFDFNGVVKESGYKLRHEGRWRKLHFFTLMRAETGV